MIDLTENQFEKLYVERSFNSPEFPNDVIVEFEELLRELRAFLSSKIAADEFFLHEYHNFSRFAEVAFTTEQYLNPTIVLGIQAIVGQRQNEWMVCLSEACYIFVTKHQIMGFDPTFEDELYLKLRLAVG